MPGGEILRAEGLTKHYVTRGLRGRELQRVRAVDGVDFSVGQGEAFGIVGESGCGKTTTGMLLMRLIPATEGKVYLKGQPFSSLSFSGAQKLRSLIQMVFQDPTTALDPRMIVRDILAEPFRIQKREIPKGRIEGLLLQTGLETEHQERFPHELSGGQKQRVVIARALALSPEILVLDEPTSALDVNVQAQILNLLQSLRERLALSYVLISHDLGVVRNMCDRVAVMYLGKIVELGSADGLFAKPRHPYTAALFSNIPSIEGGRRESIILEGDVPSPSRIPPGCRFHPRCWKCQPQCRLAEPELVEKTPGSLVACHFA